MNHAIAISDGHTTYAFKNGISNSLFHMTGQGRKDMSFRIRDWCTVIRTRGNNGAGVKMLSKFSSEAPGQMVFLKVLPILGKVLKGCLFQGHFAIKRK